MDFAQDWSARDYALLGGALGATYADAQTTKDLVARGGEEANPMYGGSKPSGTAIDRGALLNAGLGTIATMALPEKYRGAFLGGWMGLKVGLAEHNVKTDPKSGGNMEQAYRDSLPGAALGALAGYLLPGSHVTPYASTEKGKPEVGIAYTRKF